MRRSVFLDLKTEETVTLKYPLQQKRRGVETRLVIGGRPQNIPDPKLIKTVAQARHWYHQLKTSERNSILEISEIEKIDASEVSRILPLGFLAPSIIQDVLSGNQPVELTAKTLQRKTAYVPVCWNEQQAYLGFKI